MKKTFTKLAGGIMAASMILGTAGVAAPSVFADDASTLVTQDVARKIVINLNNEDSKDHTYNAYEIFDGVYDTTAQVLKQITWGANIATDDDKKATFTDAKLEELAIILEVATTNENGEYTGIKTVDGKPAIASLDALKDAEVVADLLGGITENVAVERASNTNNVDKTTGTKASVAIAFAEFIDGVKTNSPVISSDKKEDNSGYEITVNTGYWLITDTTAGGVSDRILKLAKDESETINPKSSVPESYKKLLDVNDSTGEKSADWEDTADYDIGDFIPYELVASLGDGVENYKTYWMNFVDTISEGLELQEDTIQVVIDYEGDGKADSVIPKTEGTTTVGYKLTKTENQTIAPAAGTEPLKATKYEIEIDDLFACTGVDKDSISGDTVVKVLYTAKLGAKAKFNQVGNPNNFVLEYNRNPKSDGKPTPDDKGQTTEDRNVVFTYTLDVNKVDSAEQPLPGAKFNLYKKITETGTYKVTVDATDATKGTFTYKCGEEWTIEKDAQGNVTKREVTDKTKTVEVVKGSKLKESLSDEVKTKKTLEDNVWYVVLATEEEAKPVYEEGSTDKIISYTFSFDGIDDGDYVLIESVVPSGYNPTDCTEFKVTATHTQDPNKLELTELKSSNSAVTASLETGLASTIENKKGTELPSTGGIGTTIFYIVGAAAAVTAVVLLTTRRRANKED